MGETVNYRIEGKHREGCDALKHARSGFWCTCWSSYALETVSRAIDGTRRGKWHQWTRYRCNCADCNATILIRVDHILEAAPRGEG